MSRKWIKIKAKNKKKEEAEKKKKRKKIGIFCIFAILLIAVSGLIIFLYTKNANIQTETFSYQGQTVQLFENGNFTASLAHNVRKNGTYTKTIENDIIVVSFNINGNIEVGRIMNNSLYLPEEWDDGHGHGNIFSQVNQSNQD